MRNPLFSVAVALIILVGLLFLFPWHWVLLLTALLVLLTWQVVLVRRHMRVVERGGDDAGTRPAARTGGDPRAGRRRDTAPAPAPGERGGEESPAGAGLDPDVFSRFRAHLEQAERSEPEEPAQGPLSAEEAAAVVSDHVELSGSAPRRDQAPPSSPSPPSPSPPAAEPAQEQPSRGQRFSTVVQEEEGEDDLFADLRPEPPPGTRREEGPNVRRGASATPLPPSDEVQSALDEARSPDNLQREGAMLLRLAEEALQRGDGRGAETGLGHYFELMEEAPQFIVWEAEQLKVHLALQAGRYDEALDAFSQMFQRGFAPGPDEVVAAAEGLLESAAEGQRPRLRVQLLLRALAWQRQQGDRPGMDHLYPHIIAAQEAAGDERKALQYMKNHLEIRKVLGDVPGQLELIDRIGNRSYKLGETEEARAFYEMGLRLRAEHGEVAAAGDGADDEEAAARGPHDDEAGTG